MLSKRTNKLCTDAHHSDRSVAVSIFANGTNFMDMPRIQVLLVHIYVWVGGLCSLLLCVVLHVLILKKDTYAHPEDLYINNRRQQFSGPVILTTDDDHNG
jgi:hypothetical protein